MQLYFADNYIFYIFALHITYYYNMTSMTIRVDEQLKQRFDFLCDEFGLSSSAALNIFMKAVVRERRIPFEISAVTEKETREQGWEAFMRMREAALASDAAKMTMDEIDGKK